MAYKSLLAIATDPDRCGPVVATAAALARAQDAHLDLLAVGIDRIQAGYAYVGAGSLMVQAGLERASADAREVETALRAAAEAETGDLRWSVEPVVAQLGGLSDLVALRARFADLTVLGRPYGDHRGVEAEAIVEAALFEAHAPVLVLPDDKPPAASFGRRIALAWNQSDEAMRATRLALPFLQAAEIVSITVIDPPSHGPERSDPGGLLCQMLVRHGVRAEVAVLARSLNRVSDVLARHVRDMGADMLVMGAYGHSRLRESILGGATRDLLERSEVPLFMAH